MMSRTVVLGCGSYLPSRIMTNVELAQTVEKHAGVHPANLPGAHGPSRHVPLVKPGGDAEDGEGRDAGGREG